MSQLKQPPKVTFLKGPTDDFQVELIGVGNNGEHRIATMGNSSNIYANLRRNLPLSSSFLLLHPQRKSYPVHHQTQVFFNELADPDNSKQMLVFCEKFLKNLSKKRPVVIINPPSKVLELTRDEVYRRLKDIEGVLTPQTIRCAPTSPEHLLELASEHHLAFPFLVRSVGLHGGQDLQKINGPKDLSLLHRYPFDGRSFYLTHFVDFINPKGYYSKIRLAVVEGRPFIRHCISDHHWCIHSHNREQMNLHQEWVDAEVHFLEAFDEVYAPQLKNRVQAIAKALDLDYFGIDACLLEDGRLLIFEANAAMNMLINPAPKPNIFEAPLVKIKQALVKMILSRLPQKTNSLQA